MNKITIKKTNMIKEEDITPGFNDSFVTLNCKNCLKKYHSFIDYLGNMWSLYEKEKH